MQDQEPAGGNAAAEPKNDFVMDGHEEKVPASDKEPKKSPEPETDEAEEGSDGNSEGQKPKRTGYQRKLDAKDQRIKELEARIAAGGNAGEQAAKPVVKADDATDGKPKHADFENYDDYNEALTDWKVEQRIKKLESDNHKKITEEKQTQEIQAKIDKFEKSKETVKEIHPDFDKVVNEAFDEVPVNPAIRAALLESDMGADIVYYLAKNPDEFDKLNLPSMGLVQIMRAFGRIEATLENGKSTEAVAVKTTQAPPPVKPVRQTAKTNDEYREDMTYEEFKAWDKRRSR